MTSYRESFEDVRVIASLSRVCVVVVVVVESYAKTLPSYLYNGAACGSSLSMFLCATDLALAFWLIYLEAALQNLNYGLILREWQNRSPFRQT